MRQELQSALDLARTTAAEELPRLLGELEEIRVTALARITPPSAPARANELLNVDQAAARLGCSTDYLYRHAKQLPFTRRNTVGRALRFSSVGLDAYLRKSR
jgi:excisionase family DNA binding protein